MAKETLQLNGVGIRGCQPCRELACPAASPALKLCSWAAGYIGNHYQNGHLSLILDATVI